MRLALGVATCEWAGWRDSVRSWFVQAECSPLLYIAKHKSIMQAYGEIWDRARYWPVTGYIHDDLICMERDWDVRILNEFKDPKVGIVGVAGATGHGDPRMYQIPYELPQLARRNFLSNMRTAEENGKRFTGACDVAVLDGMALFIRNDVLNMAGGWPQDGSVGYYLYSEYICCMARRMGYKIRLVGLACDHLSGRSTGLNPKATFDFEGEHRWLYNNFSDVLPAEVR